MSTTRLDQHLLGTMYLSDNSLNNFLSWLNLTTDEHHGTSVKNALILSIIICLIYIFSHIQIQNDGLEIVNRRFRLEPRVFARIRWATRSRDILQAANEKVGSVDILATGPC